MKNVPENSSQTSLIWLHFKTGQALCRDSTVSPGDGLRSRGKIVVYKLLSKHHDVVYKKLSPYAQMSDGEYHGRIEAPKAVH